MAVLALAGTAAAVGPDPERDPRPKLLPEADPTTNPSRAVPPTATSDADGILTVATARWDDSTNPMRLVWDVPVAGGGTVPCFDCLYLAPHVRRFVARVLDQRWAPLLTGVDGLDPTQAAPGQFAGNGWAVTLRVPEDESGFATTGRDGGAALQDTIVRWLLACNGDGPCRSQRVGVTAVTASNRVWSVRSCRRPVRDARPQLVDPTYDGVVRATPAPEVVRAANERVYAGGVHVALALFTPRFRTEDGATVVDGFRSTDCPVRDGDDR